MYEEIPVDSAHVYAFTASGKLTDADYQAFVPRIEEILQQESPISLLIKLEDFEGWEARAAWDDLKFGIKHQQEFARIAIVGEKTRDHWMTMIGNVFVDTQVRYFDHGQSQQALQWLQQVTNQIERDLYAGYRHIMLATDFSEHSERALRRARELAEVSDARLTLLHVVDDLMMPGEFYDLAVDIELEKTLLEVAHQRMDELTATIESGKLNAEVITGNPGHAITHYAREHDVDLIVIGSHGRRGIERLLGSSVNAVLHNAHCDVLTVRL
ncbi:MAG: universal stress protein [Pseudomonadota bacterium]